MKKLTLIISLLVACIAPASAQSATINVPADQPTIQAGVDAALSGDTVLVAPGTYFENVVLDMYPSMVITSHFAVDGDPSHIFNTIIDGSQPYDTDSASVFCIRLATSATIVQGFTITGGTGTVWTDEHGHGIFREGGGFLLAYASCIIQNNVIIDNEANIAIGVISAGGGAIRVGDGDPLIRNNIIMHNRGRYGAGIVFNYCAGVARNNVIAYNTGGSGFAGSGVWKYRGSNSTVENNTIVFNESTLPGGGIYIASAGMVLKNNIIWGNEAPSEPQIRLIGGAADVSYCVVEGGWEGVGNIDLDPEVLGQYLFISPTSPCIDSGDPATEYDDAEDPGNPGFALWPALGSLRNDIGAHGGPLSMSFLPGEDGDLDGYRDVIDNCVTIPNSDQIDRDGDHVGDDCDNCQDTENPDQEDSDEDGFGDACDICPGYIDLEDADGDNVPDSCDNCPDTENPGQEDSDNDGIGDVCEGCCGWHTGWYTGNCNCSEDGKRTLADITSLIDRVFVAKLDLCCEGNGNVNGSSDGKITLADITRLIDHVFVSKAETEPCP